jgi:hypothetical protein
MNFQGRLCDGTFGHVIYTKGDRQSKRRVDCFVGVVFLEVEGTGTSDVGCHEDGARVVAGQDLNGGGIEEVDECAGSFDKNVFSTKEAGIIATMPNQELVFDASVGVGDGAALWLDDGADAFVRCDDVEICTKFVICQSNTVF